MKKERRVVIVGMGMVSCIGTGLETYWKNLLAGKSGIRRITQFDASAFPCQIAGEVPDFNPDDYMDRKEARRISRGAQMALASARMAIAEAHLTVPLIDPERAGVSFGTAIGGVDKLDDGIVTIRTTGYDRLNPFVIPASLPNSPAFVVAREFQCLGPTITVTTACATGTQAVGEGAEFIWRGSADIVLAGGSEAVIRDFAIGGFCAMRALPVGYNESPEKASRPFDKDRDGFIYSEGSAILVLEELEHARARGARIYAEVAGQASSCDGVHPAAPDPEANGPARAIRWALQDAGLGIDEIDYINAHGTGTQANDNTETKAIKKVFGERAYRVPISSIKSMLGHAMGASGALEAIATTMVVNEGKIPPTINYETPDPECDLDYVPNTMRAQPVRAGLSNSFGLGGQNACLVIKRYED